MKEKFYPFRASEDYLFYYFESRSEERTIHKAVQFEKIGADIYNRAFGALDENREINDFCVSNNQDMNKVLATVVRTALTFFEAYPDRRVYFTGSSKARLRLYSAILAREFENWKPVFEVLGIQNGNPVPFEQGVNYESFIINRKSI